MANAPKATHASSSIKAVQHKSFLYSLSSGALVDTLQNLAMWQ